MPCINFLSMTQSDPTHMLDPEDIPEGQKEEIQNTPSIVQKVSRF
jgi:hypothetical protein